MDVSRIRALRGPNLWSRHTAIEAVVTCPEAECSIDGLPGFEAHVRKLFPSMGPLRPDGRPGQISVAHVLETVALALQAQAGCPVTFSRTSQTVEAGTYQVVVEYSEEPVGKKAFDHAIALIEAALKQEAFDVEAALAELRELDEDVRLGPSTGSIVDAAVVRGIPFRRLTQGSLVQFGWGSKQRRIWAAEVDNTSAVAESIAQDKDLTKRLLASAGVPVPTGRPVTDFADACLVAEEIGWPVVVKPRDGNQGKGVTVNIVSNDHLGIAYKVAAEYGEVMVERYLPGNDFRLLVVGDRLVAWIGVLAPLASAVTAMEGAMGLGELALHEGANQAVVGVGEGLGGQAVAGGGVGAVTQAGDLVAAGIHTQRQALRAPVELALDGQTREGFVVAVVARAVGGGAVLHGDLANARILVIELHAGLLKPLGVGVVQRPGQR